MRGKASAPPTGITLTLHPLPSRERRIAPPRFATTGHWGLRPRPHVANDKCQSPNVKQNPNDQILMARKGLSAVSGITLTFPTSSGSSLILPTWSGSSFSHRGRGERHREIATSRLHRDSSQGRGPGTRLKPRTTYTGHGLRLPRRDWIGARMFITPLTPLTLRGE